MNNNYILIEEQLQLTVNTDKYIIIPAFKRLRLFDYDFLKMEIIINSSKYLLFAEEWRCKLLKNRFLTDGYWECPVNPRIYKIGDTVNIDIKFYI